MPAEVLGVGVFDPAEAAHLVGLTPARVLGMTTDPDGRNYLLTPAHPWGALDFSDLVTLHVAAELLRRKVRIRSIKTAMGYLAEELGTPRPFAHEQLATSGSGIFVERSGDLVDPSLRGQLGFIDFVRPSLKSVEYEHHMAARWRPHKGVLIDPLVQFGSPCIRGRRVPTSVIRQMTDAGDDIATIAWAMEVSEQSVRNALDYEAHLDELRQAKAA